MLRTRRPAWPGRPGTFFRNAAVKRTRIGSVQVLPGWPRLMWRERQEWRVGSAAAEVSGAVIAPEVNVTPGILKVTPKRA